MRVKIVSKKFNVNKEKGMVTCIIWGRITDDDSKSRYFYPDMTESVPDKDLSMYSPISFRSIGTAVCNIEGGDVFDEEIGKKISYCKAKIGMFDTAKRYIRAWKTSLNTLNEGLDKSLSLFESERQRSKEKLKKYK